MLFARFRLPYRDGLVCFAADADGGRRSGGRGTDRRWLRHQWHTVKVDGPMLRDPQAEHPDRLVLAPGDAARGGRSRPRQRGQPHPLGCRAGARFAEAVVASLGGGSPAADRLVRGFPLAYRPTMTVFVCVQCGQRKNAPGHLGENVCFSCRQERTRREHEVKHERATAAKHQREMQRLQEKGVVQQRGLTDLRKREVRALEASHPARAPEAPGRGGGGSDGLRGIVVLISASPLRTSACIGGSASATFSMAALTRRACIRRRSRSSEGNRRARD